MNLSYRLLLAAAASSLIALSANGAVKESQALLSASAIALDDPNPIEPAKKLYTYLYELSRSDAKSNKLISGHWLGASFKSGKPYGVHPEDYPFSMQEPLEIRRHTGKWIGMIDGWICPGEFGDDLTRDVIEDCMWYDDMIAEYTLWWRNGGIVHTDASFFAPLKDRYTIRNPKGNVRVDVDSVLTPGTPDYLRWRAIADRMTVFFKALEERGIPVIFRPFTEAYINGFWYSRDKIGDEGSKRLWADLHHYLTEVKGCRNIIWDFQGGRGESHYPGDAYVDVYTTKSEYHAWKIESFQTLAEDDLPMGNAELGDYGISPHADAKGKERMSWMTWLEAIKDKAPRLSFYTSWDREWGPVKRLGESGRFPDYDPGYSEMITNDYVLNRDELSFPLRPSTPSFTPEPGQWIKVNGTWTVDGTGLARSDAPDEGKILYGNTDWTDYNVQATFKVTPVGETGIMGRCASTDIYYLLSIQRTGVTLSRRFNATFNTLAFWPHPFEPGQSCTVKLAMQGDKIEGYVDTGKGLEKRVSVIDDSIPCGCIGFRAYDAPSEITGITLFE